MRRLKLAAVAILAGVVALVLLAMALLPGLYLFAAIVHPGGMPRLAAVMDGIGPRIPIVLLVAVLIAVAVLAFRRAANRQTTG